MVANDDLSTWRWLCPWPLVPHGLGLALLPSPIADDLVRPTPAMSLLVHGHLRFFPRPAVSTLFDSVREEGGGAVVALKMTERRG